jgi:hypothetical protein
MEINLMKFNSDIDIDFGNREQILSLIKHTPASMVREDKLTKHNTGVYFTEIPIDPFTGLSNLEYHAAEERGYLKLDFLNVGVYQLIRDEDHLTQLLNQTESVDDYCHKEFSVVSSRSRIYEWG